MDKRYADATVNCSSHKRHTTYDVRRPLLPWSETFALSQAICTGASAPGPLHRGLCPSVFRVPITGLDTGSQRITWDFDPTATSGPTTQNPLYVKKKQEHKSLFVFCLREWTIEFCQQCKAKSLFAVFPSQSGPASLPTGWRRTSTAYMPFPFRRQRSKLSTTFVRTLR